MDDESKTIWHDYKPGDVQTKLHRLFRHSEEVDNMSVRIGDVVTFANVQADKAQVVKIAEEYGEIYSAWEDWRETGLANKFRYASYNELTRARMRIVDECADCITAIANLLVALGVDDNQMQRAMQDCAQRNRDRGRL